MKIKQDHYCFQERASEVRQSQFKNRSSIKNGCNRCKMKGHTAGKIIMGLFCLLSQTKASKRWPEA